MIAGLVLAFLVQSTITIGLAEIGSAFPVSQPLSYILILGLLTDIVFWRPVSLLLPAGSGENEAVFWIHHRVDVGYCLVGYYVWMI